MWNDDDLILTRRFDDDHVLVIMNIRYEANVWMCVREHNNRLN